MTETQSAAAMRFYLGDLPPLQDPEAPLFAAFGVDFQERPERLLELLADTFTSRRAEDVESLLAISHHFGALTRNATPVLCRLLLADFHHRHEDIARCLQDLRDPDSVPALYDACFLDLPYLHYDDGDALARKCTWALHDVGTPEAFDRLRALTQHPRPSVIGYALKRLTPPAAIAADPPYPPA